MIRQLLKDWAIVRQLRKRGWQREKDWIIQRKIDGHLFAPGSPQNFAYAMQGVFSGKDSFHFYRVREWHGLLVASRRVFWRPTDGREFSLIYKAVRFDLARWPEGVECAKIDEAAA